MAKRKEIIKVDSGIPNASLIFEKGAEGTKIRPQTIKRFFVLIRNFRKAEDEQEHWTEKKVSLKDKLIKLISRFELSSLGLQTEKDALRTTVYKSITKATTFSREPLKSSLGTAYEGVVHEDLQLTILLTPDKPQQRLVQSLKDLLGEENYQQCVKEEILLRVDEKKLDEMIAAEQATLEKDARVIEERISWNVKTLFVKG